MPGNGAASNLGEVQLLAGINGTGKTRLLSCLAAALGGQTPLKRRIDNQQKGRVTVGAKSASVDVLFEGRLGSNVLSVKAAAYSGVAYVADQAVGILQKSGPPAAAVALDFVKAAGYERNAAQLIANLKIKSAMAALSGADSTQSNGATSNRPFKLIRTIEDSLSEISGRRFVFFVEERSENQHGVVAEWGGKRLPWHLLPDGLRSIIGWLVDAAVVLDSQMAEGPEPLNEPCILLLDEPECHLHPAWQRRILPIAQRVFSKAQIFVATHSPFVICSLNQGWIHKLKIDAEGVVTADAPIPAKPGDSYISVLEDIMGVDEWFDPETHAILDQFKTARDKAIRGDDAAAAEARELAETLQARGPEVADIIIRERKQLDRLLAQPVAR